MKVSVFWVWFLVVGLLFMFFTISSGCAAHDTPLPIANDDTKAKTWTRKLKEVSYKMTVDKRSTSSHNVNLEDYHQVDPPPSSSTITSGPIEHGSPLNPYIPKPTPSNNGTSTPPPSPGAA